MSALIHDLDCFGHPIRLNFNKGGPSHTTLCGGIVSIVFYLLAFILVITKMGEASNPVEKSMATYLVEAGSVKDFKGTSLAVAIQNETAKADGSTIKQFADLTEMKASETLAIGFEGTQSNQGPKSSDCSALLAKFSKSELSCLRMGSASSDRSEFFRNSINITEPEGAKAVQILAQSSIWDSEGEKIDIDFVLSEIFLGNGLNYNMTVFLQENYVDTLSSSGVQFGGPSEEVTFYSVAPEKVQTLAWPAQDGEPTKIVLSFYLDQVGLHHTYRVKGLLVCLAEAAVLVIIIYAVLFIIMRPVAHHSYTIAAMEKMYLARTRDPKLLDKPPRGPMKRKSSNLELEVKNLYEVRKKESKKDPNRSSVYRSDSQAHLRSTVGSARGMSSSPTAGQRVNIREASGLRSRNNTHKDFRGGVRSMSSDGPPANFRNAKEMSQIVHNRPRRMDSEDYEGGQFQSPSRSSSVRFSFPSKFLSHRQIEPELQKHRQIRIKFWKSNSLFWKKLFCCYRFRCTKGKKLYHFFLAGQSKLENELDITKMLKKIRHHDIALKSSIVHNQERMEQLHHARKNVIDVDSESTNRSEYSEILFGAAEEEHPQDMSDEGNYSMTFKPFASHGSHQHRRTISQKPMQKKQQTQAKVGNDFDNFIGNNLNRQILIQGGIKGLGNYSIANENIQRVSKPHVNEVYRLGSKSVVNAHLDKDSSSEVNALQQYHLRVMKKTLLGLRIAGFHNRWEANKKFQVINALRGKQSPRRRQVSQNQNKFIRNFERSRGHSRISMHTDPTETDIVVPTDRTRKAGISPRGKPMSQIRQQAVQSHVHIRPDEPAPRGSYNAEKYQQMYGAKPMTPPTGTTAPTRSYGRSMTPILQNQYDIPAVAGHPPGIIKKVGTRTPIDANSKELLRSDHKSRTSASPQKGQITNFAGKRQPEINIENIADSESIQQVRRRYDDAEPSGVSPNFPNRQQSQESDDYYDDDDYDDENTVSRQDQRGYRGRDSYGSEHGSPYQRDPRGKGQQQAGRWRQ